MGIVRKAPGKSIVWHRYWEGNIQRTGAEPGQFYRIAGRQFGVSDATDENGTRARTWTRNTFFLAADLFA